MKVQVPDGVCGEYKIQTFNVSKESSEMTRLRAMVKRDRYEFVPEGDYKRLMRGHTVVMSNTPMEVMTNTEFVRQARGNVLINGLGLGMVLTAVLEKKEVEKVTVVELSKEVIDLVSPTFKNDPRVTIINQSAFDFKPKEFYDVVWHDIWDNITADNIPEMQKLHRKFGRRSGWQGSWCHSECKEQMQESKRRMRGYW